MSGLISGVGFVRLHSEVYKAFLGSHKGKFKGRARTVRPPAFRVRTRSAAWSASASWEKNEPLFSEGRHAPNANARNATKVESASTS